MELLTILQHVPAHLLLIFLVLLHEPSNRNAVRLLRAWKAPGGK
ncbi:hypothetical protein V1638_15385 [Pseudarthrobacter sp. J64]|nr:hypothetical protein [Pseudarthrobacter sp. J64]MEE2570767.1 hypothetical protein [Pseudarthrobacter sp. J64]